MVFRISVFLVIALALVAGSAPKQFEAVSATVLAAVIQNAGWLYQQAGRWLRSCQGPCMFALPRLRAQASRLLVFVMEPP